MNENNSLTHDELDTFLALYQSLVTIITFVSGFVFVTIPLIIFSTEISSLYGRLIIYLLLAAFIVYTIVISLYHSAALRACQQTIPKAYRIIRKYREVIIAERLQGIGALLMSSSISFMLLQKGQEWIIEAIVWFLVSIGILSIHIMESLRTAKSLKQRSIEAQRPY